MYNNFYENEGKKALDNAKKAVFAGVGLGVVAGRKLMDIGKDTLKSGLASAGDILKNVSDNINAGSCQNKDDFDEEDYPVSDNFCGEDFDSEDYPKGSDANELERIYSSLYEDEIQSKDGVDDDYLEDEVQSKEMLDDDYLDGEDYEDNDDSSEASVDSSESNTHSDDSDESETEKVSEGSDDSGFSATE